MTGPRIVLIGLSGCSSSGKTTLAKLTSELFSNATLIHEDDFYKHDEDVPINEKYGIRDWDSPEALDLELLKKELKIIKQTGEVATELIHNNNVHDTSKFNLSSEFSVSMDGIFNKLNGKFKIIIVDGFMLYNNAEIASEFDLKLLIGAPYETLKKRRQERNGYQTLDSFWVDPPYYFDEFVYKSYRDTHKHLFTNNDVEGSLNAEAAAKIKYFVNDDNVSIEESLTWVINQIATYCGSLSN